MAANDEPRSAAEVIDRVQIEWAALEYAVATLPETQLTAPGPEGWSVKDHLAHIGDWERAITAVLERRPEYQGFGLNEATYAGLHDDLDGLNDVLYRRSKAVAIAEVHARRRRAHAELLDALNGLSDADIQKPLAEFGGDPENTRRLLDAIAGDTYAHYAEHTLWIRTLVNHLAK